MQVTKAQLVQSLRQESKGFQKASSQFRGVTRVCAPIIALTCMWCSFYLSKRSTALSMTSRGTLLPILTRCASHLLQHQKGKWEARIGQATGKKYKCV